MIYPDGSDADMDGGFRRDEFGILVPCYLREDLVADECRKSHDTGRETEREEIRARVLWQYGIDITGAVAAPKTRPRRVMWAPDGGKDEAVPTKRRVRSKAPVPD